MNKAVDINYPQLGNNICTLFPLRVVVQNERYDDWTPTIIELKRLFNNYREHVLHYHARDLIGVPQARNSTAAEGNFLEVLNMALNGEDL